MSEQQLCVQSSRKDLIDCLHNAGSTDSVTLQEFRWFTTAWNFPDSQFLDSDVTTFADCCRHCISDTTLGRRTTTPDYTHPQTVNKGKVMHHSNSKITMQLPPLKCGHDHIATSVNAVKAL